MVDVDFGFGFEFGGDFEQASVMMGWAGTVKRWRCGYRD